MKAKPGQKVRWVSKSVHPACVGIIGTYIKKGVVKLPPETRTLDPTMGPNWWNEDWFEVVEEENEFGPISP